MASSNEGSVERKRRVPLGQRPLSVRTRAGRGQAGSTSERARARRRGRRGGHDCLFREPEEQSVLGYQRIVEIGVLARGEARKAELRMKTQ